jgi:hypothetical protein
MNSHTHPFMLNLTISGGIFHLIFYLCVVQLTYIKVFRSVNDNNNGRNSVLKRILFNTENIRRGRDRAVGIATGYGLNNGVRLPVGSRIFSFPRRKDRLWGPSSLLSNGYQGPFPPGVQWQGLEGDHSPPASAEVNKMWIYTSSLPYAFMV